MPLPTIQNDTDLWAAFQEGREWALEYMYVAHYKYLFNYGLRFCQDRTLVEDYIQDLFVELWKSRAKLSATDSIRFYLLKSLRNKIYRQNLYYRSRFEHLTAEESYPFFVEYSFEDSLIEQTVSHEQKQRLLQVLNSLPARQKEILYLRFYSELSYEEICAVMGISYQTARNQFHQAIKAVRQDMAVSVLACLTLCKAVFL